MASTCHQTSTTSRRQWLLAPAAALAVIATAVPAAWSEQSQNLLWVVNAAERPSLLPGGSVYDSQVPGTSPDLPYLSTVYEQQVPAAAR
jgi:hypothetical protein